MTDITLNQAVTKLQDELKDDKTYYYAWQSNIAMAFYDEMSKYGMSSELPILEISNESAKKFLNNLINEI